MKNYWLLSLIAILFVVSCDDDPVEPQASVYKVCLEFAPGDEVEIETALLSLVDSTKIILAEGNYSFENLSVDGVNLLLIQGAGQGKTVLDFSTQTSGGEGIRITNTRDVTLRGLTVQESLGDLIKLTQCRNVVLADIAAIWAADADSTSGGYALYPVLCTNVLIDSCYAQGASDAGIYVGQSDVVIVRNSSAAKNVAGCELENTTNAVVYDNEFYNNTAGLLVFDLPGLSKKGGNIKAYDNYIHDNNFTNFAPVGGIVAIVPPGTGVLHLAMSDVEYYDNIIENNNLASFEVVTGFAVNPNAIDDISAAYSPFPKNVYIHDNTMSKSATIPQTTKDHPLGGQLADIHAFLNNADPTNHPEMQHILIDGLNSNLLAGHDTIPNPDNLCFIEDEAPLFLDADLARAGTLDWMISIDATPYQNCP